MQGWSDTFARLGSRILNAAVLLEHSHADDSGSHSQNHGYLRLPILLRLLGFFLIDAAHQVSSSSVWDEETLVRVFKIALQTCRVCLDNNETELAMKVLQRCSDFTSIVEEDASMDQIAIGVSYSRTNNPLAIRHLVVLYYILRLLHASKTDRTDLTSHLYTKIDKQELEGSADLTEKAAEVLHIVGKAYQAREAWDEITKWCQRALLATLRNRVEHQSQYRSELRLAITTTAVAAYLRNGSPNSFIQANRLVEELADTNATCYQLGPDILRFHILIATPRPDLSEVDDVVFRMIRSTWLTDRTFEL